MLGRDTPIVLDKDEISRDPKAVAVEWLQKYKDLPRPPYATEEEGRNEAENATRN